MCEGTATICQRAEGEQIFLKVSLKKTVRFHLFILSWLITSLQTKFSLLKRFFLTNWSFTCTVQCRLLQSSEHSGAHFHKSDPNMRLLFQGPHFVHPETLVVNFTKHWWLFQNQCVCFSKGFAWAQIFSEKLKLCMSFSMSSIAAVWSSLKLSGNSGAFLRLLESVRKFPKGLHELRKFFEKLKLCISFIMSSNAALSLLSTADSHWRLQKLSQTFFQTLQFSYTPKRERVTRWETHRNAFIHTNTHRVSKPPTCERRKHRDPRIPTLTFTTDSQRFRELRETYSKSWRQTQRNTKKCRETQRHSEHSRN